MNMSKTKSNPSLNFSILGDGEKWKKIAKRLARSIVRFDNNHFAYNLSESALALARRVSSRKFQ